MTDSATAELSNVNGVEALRGVRADLHGLRAEAIQVVEALGEVRSRAVRCRAAIVAERDTLPTVLRGYLEAT